MPMYEYICESCGHEWDEQQKINDSKIKICPHCNKESARRMISKSSFVLCGGGWAREGYSTK